MSDKIREALEAAIAYNESATQLFGEYARLNSISDTHEAAAFRAQQAGKKEGAG